MPEPLETTTKSRRKVEPVETSTRSNRKHDQDDGKEPADITNQAPKRRFLPQPVETSVKSSRDRPAVRPAPEPTPEPSPKDTTPPPAEKPPKPRRKFAPQLIETTKRTKRAGDKAPATLPTDKTDITPGTNHIYLPRRKVRPPPVPLAPGNTPVASAVDVKSFPPAPRRQGSMKPHNNTRRSTRLNSFQLDLDTIPSSESSGDNDEGDEDEGTPSLTASYGSSEDSRLQWARRRESCDDRFAGYLLELAAKAAEKQLREQALAAFPNSDYHEIVEHFYTQEVEVISEDEDVIGVGMLPHEDVEHREVSKDVNIVRRKSTEVGWAAREMQQHQEKLSRLREEETHKKVAAESIQPTFNDPFWTNGMTNKLAAAVIPAVDKQKEAELSRMRKAATPPMLGGDLKFRFCPSPQATKLETDQRIDHMPKRRADGGGLWGGYCVASEEDQYLSPAIRGPPLLRTPAIEIDDPFASAFSSSIPKEKPVSKELKGVQMLSGLDDRLKGEATRSKLDDAVNEEFDDQFITQVYNYLSLGYPAIAVSFDEELSKISQIPVEELRKDDNSRDAKGHIQVGDKSNKDSFTKSCSRWQALRIYILEWARQHPSMSNGVESPGAWGVRARRGSWAI